MGGRRSGVGPGTVLAGILLAGTSCAFALNPALDASQYSHTAWKVRADFTRGVIDAIAQMADGYLLLGTEFGLLRFDGVRTLPWEPAASQQLPDQYVRSLLVARDGTLWIGTGRGLASWKAGKLTRYAELDGQSIWTLLEDLEGTVWVGGQAEPVAKLCAIRGRSIQCHGDDGPFGQFIESIFEDRGRNLWVGGITGLWRWKPGPPEHYPMPDTVLALMEGDSGALALAMPNGLRQFTDGKAGEYPSPPGALRFAARSILRDRDGGLWVGTKDRGIVHVHQGRTDIFERTDGLSGDFIERVFEDREGNVWVATLDGLDRFRDIAVPTISVKQGLSNATVESVLAARDGSVWLGTVGGLNRWNNGQVTVYRKTAGGLPDDAIESLFQDDRDRIWVATRRGLAYLENGKFTPVSAVPGGVESIAGEHDGTLWFSQKQNLYHLRDGEVVEQFPWAKLGREDHARTMFADPVRGGLWLGFQRGVAYFKGGEIRASYTAADGLGDGRVRDIHVDGEGAAWAATEGGLSRLKDGRIATLARKNGLPCDDVQWMREDDDHAFWLYMACGLVRLAGAELDGWVRSAYQDPKRQVNKTVFDPLDGVRSHSTTTGFSPSVAKSADGKLWFLPWDGVSVVDPHRLPVNKLRPPVLIESTKINSNEVSPTAGMKLSRRTKDIEIDYTALSLTITERVKFRYKLEGEDREWHEVGTRRQAYYNDLKPNTYRFLVMACNNDGVWSEAANPWSFTIVPAFYQTAWFQGFCGLAGGALIWLLYRLRLRQMTARVNLRYTERLAERTRIARELHDTLLQSLAGVSLQLHGIAKQTAVAPERTVSLIGHVREQVDSCFREVRLKVWNLRSPALEDQGLAAALRDFIERFGQATTARCGFAVAGQPRPCPPEIEEELLGIAQEAANNANRHSRANEIGVTLEYGPGWLVLSIVDDGCGFDFEEGLGKSGHWGLKNMQERAAQIRGTCKITTAVGQGTRIEVRVPLSSWSLGKMIAKYANSSTGGR